MIGVRAALAVLLSCGSSAASSSQIPSEVYVWQRQWTAQHATALAQSRESFSGIRVLAAQIHPREGEIRARVDIPTLASDGRPVTIVLRLDGELAHLDTKRIGGLLNQLIADWRQAGVNLRGVEIDFDCARSRLDAYAQLLAELRTEMDSGLRFSITALPAWIGSKSLPGLIEQLDEVVLQVHSVSSPEQGLFDARRANNWISDFAKLSPRPLLIALPAYSAGLIRGVEGRSLVESEVSVPVAGARHELDVDPLQMRAFLDQLEHEPPRQLVGIVWFRLPLPDDRRAWSLPMLEAVVQGQALISRIDAEMRASGAAFDLVLRNGGNLDSAFPRTITVGAEHCTAADAVGGYMFVAEGNKYHFRLREVARLAAGSERVIGWLRCSSSMKGFIDVAL